MPLARTIASVRRIAARGAAWVALAVFAWNALGPTLVLAVAGGDRPLVEICTALGKRYVALDDDVGSGGEERSGRAQSGHCPICSLGGALPALADSSMLPAPAPAVTIRPLGAVVPTRGAAPEPFDAPPRAPPASPSV